MHQCDCMTEIACEVKGLVQRTKEVYDRSHAASGMVQSGHEAVQYHEQAGRHVPEFYLCQKSIGTLLLCNTQLMYLRHCHVDAKKTGCTEHFPYANGPLRNLPSNRLQ